jgi:hypothetical protein
VTNKIFGMWELAVADVYIRNGSGTNVGAQTSNTYQYMISQHTDHIQENSILALGARSNYCDPVFALIFFIYMPESQI